MWAGEAVRMNTSYTIEEIENKKKDLRKKMEYLHKQYETHHVGFDKYRKKLIKDMEEMDDTHKEICALEKELTKKVNTPPPHN